MQLEDFIQVANLSICELQLREGVVSRTDTQSQHSIKGFHSELRLVLLGTHLHIETEVLLSVISFEKEGLEASVERFEHLIGWDDLS